MGRQRLRDGVQASVAHGATIFRRVHSRGYQRALASLRAERARRLDYWTYAIGQIVGDMKNETTVRQVFADVLGEFVETMDKMQTLMGE